MPKILPLYYFPRIPPTLYLDLEKLKKKYPNYQYLLAAVTSFTLLGSYVLIKRRHFSHQKAPPLKSCDQKTRHQILVQRGKHQSTTPPNAQVPLSHEEPQDPLSLLSSLEKLHKRKAELSSKEKDEAYSLLSTLWKSTFPTLNIKRQATYLRLHQSFRSSKRPYSKTFAEETWKNIQDKHLNEFPSDLHETIVRHWLQAMSSSKEEKSKQKMLIELATFPLSEAVAPLKSMLMESKLFSLETGVYSYESPVFNDLQEAELCSYPPDVQVKMIETLYLAAHHYIDVERQATKGFNILESLSQKTTNPSVQSIHFVKALFECAQRKREDNSLQSARLYKRCIEACGSFEFEEKYHLLLLAHYHLATLQKNLGEPPEVWLRGYQYLAAQKIDAFSQEEKELLIQALQALGDFYFSTLNYSLALPYFERILSLNIKEKFPKYHYTALLSKVENCKRSLLSCNNRETVLYLQSHLKSCYEQIHAFSFTHLIKLLPHQEQKILQASYDHAEMASYSRKNFQGMQVSEASTSIKLLKTLIDYLEKKPSLGNDPLAKRIYFLYAELHYLGKGTQKDFNLASELFKKLLPLEEQKATNPIELKSLFYLGDIKFIQAKHCKDERKKASLIQMASDLFLLGAQATLLCDHDPLKAWKLRCQYRYAKLLQTELNNLNEAKKYYRKIASYTYEEMASNYRSEVYNYIDALHQYLELCKKVKQVNDDYSFGHYLKKLANIPYQTQDLDGNTKIAGACYEYANIKFGMHTITTTEFKEEPAVAVQYLRKAIAGGNKAAEERLNSYEQQLKY